MFAKQSREMAVAGAGYARDRPQTPAPCEICGDCVLHTMYSRMNVIATASGLEQQCALVNSSKTVNAHIDLAIFEDEELIGADQRHYVAESKARKAATDSLIQEVRAASNHDAAINVLSQLTSVPPQSDDLVGVWFQVLLTD